MCPRCDHVLFDGVDYMACPRCGAWVDWIDLEQPLWCCAGCDAFVNEARDEWPRCARCDRLMDRVHAREEPPAEGRRGAGSLLLGLGALAFTVLCAVQLIVVASDPVGFAFAAPIVLLLLVGAVAVVVGAVAIIPELVALARDRTTRVIHGFEHACATILEAAGHVVRRGVTSRGRFVVELANNGRVLVGAIKRATDEAILRIVRGERSLAYHRRCGTSMLVALLLVSLAIVGIAITGIACGWNRHATILIGSAAAAVAAIAARPLGLLVQRVLTVSTRFSTAQVVDILPSLSADGEHAKFLVSLRVDGRDPPR